MKTSPVIDTEIDGHFVRMVDHKDRVWFVLVDVLNAMGVHEKTHAAISDELNDSHKDFAQLAIEGGLEQVAIVSENCLFGLIFRFDQPEADPFKEWFIENFFTPAESYPARQYRALAAELVEEKTISNALSILQARIKAQERHYSTTN
jgi:hypothetical protein